MLNRTILPLCGWKRRCRAKILDDWGLEPLDAKARHDLLEILEERYGRRSTIVTSQLSVTASKRTQTRIASTILGDRGRHHPGIQGRHHLGNRGRLRRNLHLTFLSGRGSASH